MFAAFLTAWAIVRYGPCDHPMIEKRADGWYCTECGQKRA